MKNFILIITYFILLYPLIMSVIWIIGSLIFEIKKKNIPESENEIPFTIIMSIYNEEDNIKEHLLHNLNLKYNNYKILIIDDKSTDNSLKEISSINNDKLQVLTNDINIGKAASLNKLSNLIETEYFIVIDSDTILDYDFLNTINNQIEYDIKQGNNKVAAYTGNVTVDARKPNKVFRMQKIEYRAFIDLIKRTQYTFFGSVMTLSGACSVYNTKIFNEIGKFSTENATEDINISWRLNLNGYKLKYLTNALASVTTPTNVFDLIMQRKRWTNGLMQTMWQYKRDFIKPHNLDLKIYTLEIIISSLWAFAIIYTNIYYIFILYTNYYENLNVIRFIVPTAIIFIFSTILAFTSYWLSENTKESKKDFLKYYLLFPFAYFYIQPVGFILGFIETLKRKSNNIWRQRSKLKSKLILMTVIDFIISVVSLQLLLEIASDLGIEFQNYIAIIIITIIYSILMYIYYKYVHIGEAAIVQRINYKLNPSIYLTILFAVVRFSKASFIYFDLIDSSNVNKISIYTFIILIILSTAIFKQVAQINIKNEEKDL